MKKKVSFVAVILIVLAAILITVAVGNKKITDLETKYASSIEANQEKIDSLNSEQQIMIDDRQTDSEILTDLFQQVDYRDETVYVIGHKNPDLDSVASAIGMTYLLNELGITAEARLAGPLNLESEYSLSVFGYPAPEILENAANKQLWLVDHSDFQQMVDGADQARIVGVTDHHGIGSVEVSEPINVLSFPMGSASTLVFSLCTKCDVEVPQDIAGVLLAGILSDTSNMKNDDVTALDETAFAQLKKISGISDTDALFDNMLEAKLSYKGLDDSEIFYSDFKEYETNGVYYGIGNIKVAHADQVFEMSERMLHVIEKEVKSNSNMNILMFEVYDSDHSIGYVGFFGNDMELAEKVMDTAFGSSGEKQGEFYTFFPSLARKTDMVPSIDDCLNNLLS